MNDFQWLKSHGRGITNKEGDMVFPVGKEPPPNHFVLFVSFEEWEAIKIKSKGNK